MSLLGSLVSLTVSTVQLADAIVTPVVDVANDIVTGIKDEIK